jgi:hypothetical protein
MRALIGEAARRGLGLCLSVRSENPARRLYERLGFRDIPGSAATNRVGGMSIGMALRRNALFDLPPTQAHTRLEQQEPNPGLLVPGRPNLTIHMRLAFSRVLEQCGVSLRLRGRAGGKQHECGDPC